MADFDCGDCDCGDVDCGDCDCDCGDCDCDCDCCECSEGCDDCCKVCCGSCCKCADFCWVPQQHLFASCFWDCVCDDNVTCCCCCEKKRAQNQPVYDISSQVESQGQWQSRANNSTVSSQPIGGLHPHIHPSGLSTDQINFSNELNKPANADDPPPSYEQAVRLASSSSSIAVNALSPPTVPSDELPPVPK